MTNVRVKMYKRVSSLSFQMQGQPGPRGYRKPVCGERT